MDSDREIVEAFAQESLELLRAAESALNGLLTAGPAERAGLWNALLRGLHTVKGSAGFLGEGPTPRAIEHRTHAVEDRAKALHAAPDGASGEALDELAAEVGEIKALVEGLIGEEAEAPAPAPAPSAAAPAATAAPTPPPSAAAAPLHAGAPPAAAAPAPEPAADGARGADEVLRIKPERVDKLHSHFSEVLVAQLQAQALTADLVEAREAAAGLVGAWNGLQARLEELGRGLPPQRRNALRQSLRTFGEQLKERHKASYQVARRAHAIDGELRTSLVNLEDGLRTLKLMPLAPFLEGFASTVRMAAREVDKRARLEVDAKGAEIDRAVLSRLRDPLVHLVRNCVGHGIESPDERTARGKDPRGVVRLEARIEAQRVFLHVSDDGRGLDVAAIQRKAVAKGLLEPGRVLDDQGALEIILTPGFSTQEQADKLSGRGIGMDVVAETIRSIGGSISIENRPGRGATFILEVPITTSTSAGMVVRVGSARVGLPYLHVQRVMRVEKDKRVVMQGRETVEVHGDPLAIVRLADVLGIDADPAGRSGRKPAVVLRQGSRRMVLEVDEIVGAVELLIKPLCRSFADHPLILGAAVGADSEILPVVDIPSVFHLASQGAVAPRAPVAEAAAPRGPRRVLVVDDSVTMRNLERDILQGAGYEVTLAEDGVLGLAAAKEQGPFDLVLTDLQMPRLDGIGLAAALRAQGQRTLPVLMVTTVDDAPTRARAMEAGVDRYLIKRELTRDRLVGLVEELVGRGAA